MKHSHKLVGIALVVVLTLGTALSLAVNSNSDLTGRVKLTKEEGVKLQKEIASRKKDVAKEKVKTSAAKKSIEKTETPGKIEKSASEERDEKGQLGSGTLPDSTPIIETYIGACNDPFGSPTCIVNGEYTTTDLTYNSDEVVYTMRVKNTSSTTPIYMDKVFLEYTVKGIDQTTWNSRAEWKIYDASAPNTLLTRGHVYNAANVNGYVDFDWSYPGNLLNPINQPPVIPPLGTQTYIVTADIVDDTAGPNTFDYIQVRANDSLAFTPVVGGTLADAHSVNSHFIWHAASGLYYNEAYTDLMDMWGGIPNAFAQWRKRIWGAPVVVPPTVTLEIEDDLGFFNSPASQSYVYQDYLGTQYTHVGWYNLTPNAPVALDSLRLSVTGNLRSEFNYPNISSTTCPNLALMQSEINTDIGTFRVSNNSSTIQTTSGAFVATSTSWNSPTCTILGYVDLPLSSFPLAPNVANHLEIEGYFNGLSLIIQDYYGFSLLNPQAYTVAIDSSTGTQLLPSQIISGVPQTGNVSVDNTQFLIIEPVSAGAPWPITATQGQNDVVFGIFTTINYSNTLGVTLNEIAISDEQIAAVNSTQPDITNIRLYEWDYATNQPIGAPLASGLNMGAGNRVYAQNLNLYYPMGSSKHLAIVGDISPTFTTSAGFDVLFDSGNAIDDNEIEMALTNFGVSNPVTASNPAIPFLQRFNQIRTATPFSCGSLLACNQTLGNLIDVTPAAAPSTPQAMVQFQPLPMGEPYESIIVPTGSGFGNAVKVADVIIHDIGGVGLELDRFVFSNNDNTMDYSQRFGTFYLVDESTGSLIDTGAISDAGGANDGTIIFDALSWNILAGGDLNLDVLVEVLPITQANHSASVVNLYLANTNPTDIELMNVVSGADLLPSEITNYANDGDTFQQFHVTRRTQPYVSYNNGAISSTIVSTVNNKEVYSFTVAADPQGELDFSKLTINFSQTPGIQTSNLELYIIGQSTPIGTVLGSLTNGEIEFFFGPPQMIPAGSSTTYLLKADFAVIDPLTSQAASFELTADDDTTLITDTQMAVNSTNPDFVWSDRSAVSHSTATSDWTNGWLVNSFDVETMNITYQGTGGPIGNYTRTDLLTDLFNIKGQPFVAGPSGCLDTTPAQEPVWATAIGLGIITPYSTGLCGPNDVITRAATSKILASYSAFVTGNMTIISPSVQTFPDVLLATWYFDWVESMYAAMGSVYAVAGNNFYPGNLLDSVTAVTWITNLP